MFVIIRVFLLNLFKMAAVHCFQLYSVDGWSYQILNSSMIGKRVKISNSFGSVVFVVNAAAGMSWFGWRGWGGGSRLALTG